MILVEGKPREIYSYDDEGYALAKLDLQVSTVADLPALGGVVAGTSYKCGKGSWAQIIQSGGFRTLDDNGTWYKVGSSSDEETTQAEGGEG